MTKRVAIIGTGISGLTTAYLLNRKHDVCVYEANDYIGGHTATKKIHLNGRDYAIDTGFIVYNDWTYPNFIKLMTALGVASQPTEMSFSVKNLSSKMEYNGNTLNSLFAQRRNIIKPKFWRLVLDILKFNKLCKQHIADKKDSDNMTLADFIAQHKLSDVFTQNYILPMCAAIWSTSLEASANFPLSFFLKFFNNHGLLNVTNRPQWHTIIGGSNQYIAPLTESFKDRIKLNAAVSRVVKSGEGFIVHSAKGSQNYDEVVFACHSDQALEMLSNEQSPDFDLSEYRSVLGAIPYAMNEVVLHTDTSVLPKRKLAWASWNYEIEGAQREATKPAAVTYNMNILQCIESDTTFCVTLNNTAAIAKDKVLGTYYYAHPQFSPEMVKAQEQRDKICGKEGLHFCGAYWYNGFHEDGVRSALDVAKRFGESL
ncbi:FAD-dependent oxidoreductase [Glaciecola sp. MH2013]|uniref:NAD(P)/FAD-dependent oxidoreductase n=1 Tax=Glaciecola sp. MH2013 TaxID=2785524 RepID=UPI00189F6968|nr:FAD-dependent oxidoreductase [Glaciecola sp. MH2013]MBF7074698.1 FAD-dependent oxidoreductase [Glaciecola sp. MH2013]